MSGKIKHAVVTGASGYIGPALVRALLETGFRVTAVAKDPKLIDSRAKIINVRFEDLNYKAGDVPDVLIHLAWQKGFEHQNIAHLENLAGHYAFLNSLISNGLSHLVVMGSMHEVGFWNGCVDENTPTNPGSLYGVAKNSLRRAIEVHPRFNDICFQWIRAFYITGEDHRNNSLFSKILKWEAEGKESFPFVAGQREYDFIMLDELAKQIAAVANQTEVRGIINCCSGEPVSLEAKVLEFIEANKLKIRPDFGAFPERIYDAAATWGNPEKIRKIIAAQASTAVEAYK